MGPELKLVVPGQPGAVNHNIDLDAIAQRVAIAKSHPDTGMRNMARDLLVEDTALLTMAVGRSVEAAASFRLELEAAQANIRNLQTLLALITATKGELRWPAAEVEAFEEKGRGFALIAEGDEWVLRTVVDTDDAAATLSAIEQTKDDAAGGDS